MNDTVDEERLVSIAKAARFNDPRHSARLAHMLKRASKEPALSFPKMFSDPSELTAAYRFFSNVNVTPDAILSSHFEALSVACSKPSDVLVIHDTTKFEFDPNGEREDLGRDSTTGQTFFAHFSLAVSADGSRKPLGVSSIIPWARPEQKSQNEYRRWLSGIEASTSRIGNSAHCIHVTDREGDDYGLFAALVQNKDRFIIRSRHDRKVRAQESDQWTRISEAKLVIEREVARQTVVSKRTDANRTPRQKKKHPSRAPRVATLAIGASRVWVERPKTANRLLPEKLELNLVRVWEENTPENVAPIEWLIVTNEPIDSQEAVARIVDSYRARWVIEEFFKCLKSGCKIQERQLDDFHGLMNALAFFVPIACRLLDIRSIAQSASHDAPNSVLESDELLVLRSIGPYKLPKSPSNRDVFLALASLGGYQKRRQDPGWETLASGYLKLAANVQGFRLARLIDSPLGAKRLQALRD